jgi:uncharacterized protein YegJ (DUF2314 family)
MAAKLKQAFGLVAIVVGAGLLIAGVGEHWVFPGKPFRIGPLIGGLVVGATFVSFGRKWLFNLIGPDVLAVEPGNPEIAEASRCAQATLSTFWSYLAQNRYECFVKFPMQNTDGVPEHIWAVVHSRGSGSVVVSLANEPVDQPRDAAPRRVISENDIEDWQVVISDTEIRGGYSIAALERIARAQGYQISRSDKKRLRVFVDREPA